MNNTYNLKDKVTLITGAGSGLGKEMALTFAKAGAKVIVSDFNKEGGEQVVAEIKNAGGEAVFAKCDVTKTEEVQAAVKLAVDTYGRLDVGVNNAGISVDPALTGDADEGVFSKVIEINLTSVFRCMKHEITQMMKQDNGGVILNTASALGITTIVNNSAYVSSKHGVIGLTKNAAVEYGDKKIRINAICPGVIETPLLMNAPQDVIDGAAALHPMNRIGKPEEVASLAAWLVSDDASFVTGASYTVDGGWTVS